jgi:hypothetical protein
MPSINRGRFFYSYFFYCAPPIRLYFSGGDFRLGPLLDGEIMNDANHITNRVEPARQMVGELAKSMSTLKPKGACWYCNQPLDNVRRFCNKTCAEDYLTEEEAFRDSSA